MLQALALAVALAAPAAPTEIRSPTQIVAVTVYRSSARVTRIAAVDLPAGEVRLLLEDLSADLVDDSVRVGGGDATAKGRPYRDH